MEHKEPQKSEDFENCSSKKGLARFQCNAIQAVQIVFIILVGMIFMVIALDSGGVT